MIGTQYLERTTWHDMRPSHNADRRPDWLLRAIVECDAAEDEELAAICDWEVTDPNDRDLLIRRKTRMLHWVKRAAKKRYALRRAYRRYQDLMEWMTREWQDEQQMYSDLRHGG